jgi:hypothetical protein
MLRKYKFIGDFNAQKKGKLPTSHRYDRVPLLRSRPGGLSRSWLCRTCPAAKIQPFNTLAMIFKLNFYLITWPKITENNAFI